LKKKLKKLQNVKRNLKKKASKNFKKGNKKLQKNFKKNKTSGHFKKRNSKIKISDFIVRFFSYLNDVASHAQVSSRNPVPWTPPVSNVRERGM
jgi:hypothetical protein